jgi:predicted ATPase
LAHPPSQTIALNFATFLHQFRREGQLTQAQAEALIALSTEQGFALFLSYGTILRGWALTEQEQGEEGIAQMHQGLIALRAGGRELGLPHLLALLAEAYGKVEQEAEGYFLKAIEIARQQQAKSLELRAVMSLARLWQSQGKKKEAHRVLAEIYGWVTEGFDTRDLQEAKALLEELTGYDP